MNTVQVVSVDPAVQRARDAFAAMQAWPHWPEIARGAEKEYGMAQEEFERVLPEYQRFLALSAGYRGLGMLSEQVDRIWHSHLLNTVRYREFCEQFIGRFVDHLPCSSYELYGVSLEEVQGEMCNVPSTCTDPFPAPPDPSPVPPSGYEPLRQSIIAGSQRFVAAYTQAYGFAPPADLWERVSFVAEGVAC